MRKTLFTLSAAAAVCGLLSSPVAAQYGATGGDSPNTSEGKKAGTTAGEKAVPKAKSGSDEAFIQDAAADGMAEVKLGKLASEKASNTDVKQFADRLVKDHTKANDELKKVAQQETVNLPQELKPKHQKTLDHLSSLSGEAFDRAYVSHMVEDHQKAVKLFQRHSKSASNPALKQFASSTLPTLQEHLTEAKRLQREVGGSTARGTTGTKEAGESHGDHDKPSSDRPNQSPPTRNPEAAPKQ
jgi:putative membrane protein